jgi:molybdopterin-containing oxidoreductase family membrane subunit
MKAVYALYTEPADVQKAVDNLRAAGVAEPQIVVISSEPIEEYEFSHRDKATWLYSIAAAGGAVGLAFSTWLTRMSELAWPLQTGNMPIVSWWPNMIVMFELTMLGGILATVVTLFITAKIPSREPKLYDPKVSDGRILVGIENPPAASVAAIEQALVAGGGAELKTVG